MVSVFQVIKDFFPSILALAQTFLHSAHPAVVSFGSCMYKQAFAAFDSYCQQVQCDGWQLFYLALHFVLGCTSWSFRRQGFRQLEAFGERSVPKSRPRRRGGTITARLVASDYKHKDCCDYLYLVNIVHMSRARQRFFCWYFTVVLLVAFSLGGCDCFGDSCVCGKWDRTGHFPGCAQGFGGAAHVLADALCHLCEGMCISGFWFWVPYTTLPQIQNRPILLQNRGIGKSCTFKDFLSGQRQWSEVKVICCQSVSCKIGLYDFLTGEVEIDNSL